MTLLLGDHNPGQAIAEPYYCVGNFKLLVLSVSTFGVYALYWLYKNWQTEQITSGETLSPVGRAIFAPVFFYSFARRAADHAQRAEVASGFPPALLAATFVVLSVVWRLPDPWWLVSTFSVLPLLPIQNTLQRINVARGATSPGTARFNAVSQIWFAVAGVLWLLVLAGVFLPDPPESRTQGILDRSRLLHVSP